MLIRMVMTPQSVSFKQTMMAECCEFPDFNIWTAQGRYRGAKKDSTVFCVNCRKDILTLITR